MFLYNENFKGNTAITDGCLKFMEKFFLSVTGAIKLILKASYIITRKKKKKKGNHILLTVPLVTDVTKGHLSFSME